MILELEDVCTFENKEVQIAVTIDMTSFDSKLGSFPIIEKKPFELQIVNEENKRLLIRGETNVMIAIPCDRCLEEVQAGIHLVFDKELPLEEAARTDEDGMEEADYMTGFHLDVDRLVYDEILVNWPMKVLCKDDCKGICKQCGVNLNLHDCDCSKTELDPRMAAIQDVFNKFKEV